MTHWKRFEEYEPQRDIPRCAPDDGAWAVIWDGDPKIYFSHYPSSWGGSGWYADPQKVVTLPDALSVEDGLKNQGYVVIEKEKLNDLLARL